MSALVDHVQGEIVFEVYRALNSTIYFLLKHSVFVIIASFIESRKNFSKLISHCDILFFLGGSIPFVFLFLFKLLLPFILQLL